MNSLSRITPVTRAAARTLATCIIALVGAAAVASEATQFENEPSIKTRADVKAEMASTPKEIVVRQIGDATVFVDQVGTAGRTRAEVRAEARQAARDHHHQELYIGA
jgi:hypothetical protein